MVSLPYCNIAHCRFRSNIEEHLWTSGALARATPLSRYTCIILSSKLPTSRLGISAFFTVGGTGKESGKHPFQNEENEIAKAVNKSK